MYEGTEREHTCDRLTPGHTYRVRVAACSAGGRSEVIQYISHRDNVNLCINNGLYVFKS